MSNPNEGQTSGPPRTKMQKAGKDVQKTSQTIGLALAVIVVWGLQEFGVDPPTMVEQAITAVIVAIALRIGDD